MYRERIREHYDRLSRSYRRVADYIMNRYYDVSFMTAAQLAVAVGVDTTTVVRFSQRLGYNGYPQLLTDIRTQVKSEIYAAYEPKALNPDDAAGTFNELVRQEKENLNQMVIQNPPEHIREIAEMLDGAQRILLVAEGYADSVAGVIAQQLRHRGIEAKIVDTDDIKRAAALTALTPEILLIGISASEHGENVARVLQFGREQGCRTLGIVGSLASPVNRMSDLVLYAPTDAVGPLPSMVGLVAALSALVQIISRDDAESVESYRERFNSIYQYLKETEVGTSNT